MQHDLATANETVGPPEAPSVQASYSASVLGGWLTNWCSFAATISNDSARRLLVGLVLEGEITITVMPTKYTCLGSEAASLTEALRRYILDA
jgi:hypothetical protein